MSHLKLHFPRSLFCITALLLCIASICFAQSTIKIDSTQDVVIAFYKTAGAYPNFKKWIESTAPYNVTPFGRRDEVYKTQLAELLQKYDAFDPATDFLTVRTKIKMGLKQEYNYELEEYVSSINMRFKEAPEAQYFPYDYMGERFALVPNKLKDHMTAVIPAEQYQNLKRILRSSEEATMIMQLKPGQADAKSPVKMDGIYHWVLMTDIVSISLWAHTGALLWEYTAPWYVSPTTEKLMDLYVDPLETP